MKEKIYFPRIELLNGIKKYPEIVRVACTGSLRSLFHLIENSKDSNLINTRVGLYGCTSLMGSAAFGHLHCIKMLLHEGAIIDQTDEYGRTALFYALSYCQFEAFDLLIQRGSNLYHLDKEERNLLHFAAYFRQIAIAKFILHSSKQSTSLLFQNDKYGSNPFHLALYQQSEEMTQLILSFHNNYEKELLLNNRDNEGNTPIQNLCKISTPRKKYIEYLIDEGANFTLINELNGNSSFHTSIIYQQIELIRLFVSNITFKEESETEEGAMARFRFNLSQILFTQNNDGFSPIHLAILVNNKEIFDCLIACFSLSSRTQNGEIDKRLIEFNLENCVDKGGRNALHLSAFMSNFLFCKTIVRYRPSIVHSLDHLGRNLLFYAISNFRQILFDHKIIITDVNHTNMDFIHKKTQLSPSSPSSTSLHPPTPFSPPFSPIYKNFHSSAKLLPHLRKKRSLPNQVQNNNGKIEEQEELRGNLRLIDFILNKMEINIHHFDQNGRNCLHYASYFNQIEAMEMILLSRSNDDLQLLCRTRDRSGFTPLHVASLRGNNNLIELLVRMGSEIDQKSNDGSTALHLAVRNGHWKVVDLLLNLGSSSLFDELDRSPFHYACYFLMKINNKKEKKDFTTDRDFNENIEKEIMKLIDHCTDEILFKKDKEGITGLHILSSTGEVKVLSFILKKTEKIHHRLSNEEMKDKRGWTPLHHSSFHSHPLSLQILIFYFPHLLNEQDERGFTPLHLSSSNPSSLSARLLLMNVNNNNKNNDNNNNNNNNNDDNNIRRVFKKDKYGRTALHIAASIGQLSVCKLIMANEKCKFLLEEKDLFNRTAIDYAMMFNHFNVSSFLKNEEISVKYHQNLEQLFERPSPSSLPLLKSLKHFYDSPSHNNHQNVFDQSMEENDQDHLDQLNCSNENNESADDLMIENISFDENNADEMDEKILNKNKEIIAHFKDNQSRNFVEDVDEMFRQLTPTKPHDGNDDDNNNNNNNDNNESSKVESPFGSPTKFSSGFSLAFSPPMRASTGSSSVSVENSSPQLFKLSFTPPRQRPMSISSHTPRTISSSRSSRTPSHSSKLKLASHLKPTVNTNKMNTKNTMKKENERSVMSTPRVISRSKIMTDLKKEEKIVSNQKKKEANNNNISYSASARSNSVNRPSYSSLSSTPLRSQPTKPKQIQTEKHPRKPKNLLINSTKIIDNIPNRENVINQSANNIHKNDDSIRRMRAKNEYTPLRGKVNPSSLIQPSFTPKSSKLSLDQSLISNENELSNLNLSRDGIKSLDVFSRLNFDAQLWIQRKRNQNNPSSNC